jgi:4-amino-4-deoxy-L-arabinose transferase-like glycosyltransferase
VRHALLYLWRWRVLSAGLLAIALALVGEWVMRSQPADSGHTATIGVLLVQAAALLVGLVAWVHDGRRSRHARKSSLAPTTIPPSKPLSSPTAHTEAASLSPASRMAVMERWRGFTLRYRKLRARFGFRGTLVGLILMAALAVLLGLLLRDSFRNLLAPWVWLAMLCALALTFVGVSPWPAGETLLPHDPAEPAAEPPISRNEWVVLVAIIVAAALLRLVNLDNIPVGPYIDESGEALDARFLNRGELVAGVPFSFFGTGWWGVPSFYFWLVAQSLNLFGDNLVGARTIHALMGIGTVWYTYRIGRVAWSPRAGLIAGALICVSDFAIQSSRTVTVSTTTQFFWIACFYYLYLALKTRRPLHFVLCGFAAGFTLLGYASGKLLLLALPLIGLYLMLRWGLKGIRRYLPGLALTALAAGLVFAPNALYQLTQDTTALTARYNTVTLFTPAEESKLFAQYNTDNWGLIIPRQFTLSYSAFDIGQERGPFYPTGQPILSVPWAALWLLGTVYMVFRLGDARFAILALWLLGGLAGSALTKDTPTLQRAVTMTPLLAILPALFLDRVASGVPALRRKVIQVRVSALKWAPNIAIAAVVILLGVQTLLFYFSTYTARANYIEYTLAGRYVEKLDPKRDIYFDGGTPILFGDPSPLLFLAKDVPLLVTSNSSDYLPITDNRGKDVHFVVPLSEDPMFAALQSFYPDATKVMLGKPDGTPLLAAYHITAEEIDARREVAAVYVSSGGESITRAEQRLGTSGIEPGEEASDLPESLAYPANAKWSGGLVAPGYATYHFKLDAPAGATLTLDGRTVVEATPGLVAEADLVLAKGIHDVELSGVLDQGQHRIDLRWGSGTNVAQLFPVVPQYLWGGRRGILLGQTYPSAADESWFTTPELQPGSTPPLITRRDSLLSWRYVNVALGGGTYVFGSWTGTLHVPVAGDYFFDAKTPGRISMWLDGELAGVINLSQGPLLWPVYKTLSAGDHRIEIRFQTLADNSDFYLFWQPPGGTRTLLPPSALSSSGGGVWLAQERPGVPPIDPALLAASP